MGVADTVGMWLRMCEDEQRRRGDHCQIVSVNTCGVMLVCLPQAAPTLAFPRLPPLHPNPCMSRKPTDITAAAPMLSALRASHRLRR